MAALRSFLSRFARPLLMPIAALALLALSGCIYAPGHGGYYGGHGGGWYGGGGGGGYHGQGRW